MQLLYALLLTCIQMFSYIRTFQYAHSSSKRLLVIRKSLKSLEVATSLTPCIRLFSIDTAHSPDIDPDSELVEFKKELKEFRIAKSPKKLLKYALSQEDKNDSMQSLKKYLIALQFLERMNRTDLSIDMISPIEVQLNRALQSQLQLLQQVNGQQLSSPYPSGIDNHIVCRLLEKEHHSATILSIIKYYCRIQNMDVVEKIAAILGLNPFNTDVSSRVQKEVGSPSSAAATNDTATTATTDTPSSVGNSSLSAVMTQMSRSVLSEMSVGYAYQQRFFTSLQILSGMQTRELDIDLEVSKKIMKVFLQSARSAEIRSALTYLVSLGGLQDIDSLQMITATFIRNIDFVKGAVSMATLPPASHPEVAFIGRSNVGKSSLINVLANKKKLAYSSKTPGKTSEFNYFEGKGLVGKDKEKHELFIVDLPGVGYAQASRNLRSNWTNLLRTFSHERPTLRILFHLIDSRHGLLDADVECLDLLSTLPSHVEYAIVFTKVDKFRGDGSGTDRQHVGVALLLQNGIVDRIYREIAKRTTRVVKIFFTSSETRLGSVEVWDYILRCTKKDIPTTIDT